MSMAIRAAKQQARVRYAGGSGYYYGASGDFLGLGKVFKGIAKVGGAVLGATPAGRVITGVKGAIDVLRGKSAGPGQLPSLPPVPPSYPQPPTVFQPPQGGYPILRAPLGPGMVPAGTPGQQGGGYGTTDVFVDVKPAIACPRGMRPNKSGYWRRTPTGDVVFHAPGSVCVKSRRRNPLNPRALSRSLSRVASAKKAIRKVIAVQVTPKGKIPMRRKAKPK